MDNNAPPIKFAIAELAEVGIGQVNAERYDTRKEAEAALAKLDEPDNYTIVETREGHTPPPEVLAAENDQIEKNGQRDVDEPSSGLEE